MQMSRDKLVYSFVAILLLGYFAFVGGFVFEFTKSEALDHFDIPYSIWLSSERIGVGIAFTEDDVACAKWLSKDADKEVPIWTDANGVLLLSGYIAPYSQVIAIAEEVFVMPDDCYIFITTWSAEHDKMVYYSTQAGLRNYAKLPVQIKDKKVVFQSGKAKVYR